MADILWFQGRFTTTDERVLGVKDRSVLFGDAVYEVLKFLQRSPILVDGHWTRLCRSLGSLEIRNPWTRNEFEEVIEGLLERSDAEEGVIYVEVTRGEASHRSHIWRIDVDPVAFAWVSPFDFPDEALLAEGVRVIAVEESRWGRPEIKSVNLLANVLARVEAARANAHEAIFVKDGQVVEASSMSVFAVRSGSLLTRPTGKEVLAGTVRESIVELAIHAGVRVEERAFSMEELVSADEAFMTSTTGGVLPIAAVGEKIVGSGSRGPVTGLLQGCLGQLETEEIARWQSRR